MDLEKKQRKKIDQQDLTIDQDYKMSKYFNNSELLPQEDKDLIVASFKELSDEINIPTVQQESDKLPKPSQNIFQKLFTHYSLGKEGFNGYFVLFDFINLKVLDKYFEPLYFIIKSWPKQKQQDVAEQGLNILLRRVENLSMAEIKDTDSDYLKEQIYDSQIFRSTDQRYHYAERIMLTLALKFINSQYLEKRVRALIEIKELAERIDGGSRVDLMKMRPQISKETLIEWIHTNQILEQVLIGDTLHSELIKRATDIAIFLCKHDQFQVDMIDQIWQTSQNKHESTLRSIYEFFEQVSAHMKLEAMDRLYSLISQIKDYNEMTIRLICKFTENALLIKQLDDEVIDQKKFYGFNQLWQILQDRSDTQISHCIQEQAFQAARSILSNIPQTKVFNHYFFGKCFELIGEHESVYQAISFAHYILDKQFLNDLTGKQQLIMETDAKFNIVELFVLDIEVYLQKVRQVFNGQPTQDIIIQGVQTFQQNMFFRVQMLNYILSISDLTIDYEQTIRLWNACCVKTKGSIQKQELIKVFQSEKDQHSQISVRFFPDKNIKFKFFTQVLCNFAACDYKNFIIDELKLFQIFFQDVNLEHHMLQDLDNKQVAVDLDFFGKEALFWIFELVRDQGVLDYVIALIVEHFNNFTEVLQPHAHRELMDKCLQLMPRQSARCISLLQCFFARQQNGPTYFASNPHCFEMLFQVLEQDDGNVSQVWDLLTKIPVNLQMQQKLKSMDLQWDQLLGGGFYRLLYQMQMIFYMSHQQEEWKIKFMESGGLHQIMKLFLNFKFDFKKRYLELSFSFFLVELLNHYHASKYMEFDRNAVEKQCSHILFQLSLNNKLLDSIEGSLVKQLFILVGDADQFICSIGPESIIRQLLVCTTNQFLKQAMKETILDCYTLSQTLQDVLINQTLHYVLTNLIQESQYYFETIVELIKTQKIQQPPDIERLVSQLNQVDGIVRAGIYGILTQVHSTDSTSLRIIDTVYDQLLENHLNSQALECLKSLLITPPTINHFVDRFETLQMCSSWRSKSYSNWALQNKSNEKSQTGYVGLYNLACICYMNSLIQQLFMIPSFREPLLSAEDKSLKFPPQPNMLYQPILSVEDRTLKIPLQENMLYQLQCMMAALKYSQKQYFIPKKFCHSFKDFEGQPTNVFEQMDVDEFFNLLMDRLEQYLKDGRTQSLVQDNFRGFMVNEVIGKDECQHKSECEEPFFVISLPVKNKKTIMQSLKSIVQGDVLEGENAYLCDQCGKKVNAMKRMSIKRLPPHLILCLKRFEFDFDSMAKVKLNDKCEFPFELDMLPYSQQSLNKLPGLPESEFKYELKGVVIHQGSADSGHYYSFIQERDGGQGWLEFNDNIVSEAKPQDIINDGYGGVMDRRSSKVIERSKNAYLLFYERKELSQTSDKRDMEPRLLSFIEELNDENSKFQIQRVVFHQEYFNFMESLVNVQDLHPRLVIFILQFTFTCGVREFTKQWISNNFQRILNHIKRTPEAAQFLSRAFEQQTYIKEFLQECPFSNVRKFMVSMIAQAASQSGDYNTDACMIFLGEGKHKNYTEFFDLVHRLALVYPEQLVKSCAIGRLLDFFIVMSNNYKNKKQQYNQEEIKQELEVPRENTSLGVQDPYNDASSYYDEIIEKRFERGSNRYQSRQYLWMAIAHLLKFTTMGGGTLTLKYFENNMLYSDHSVYVSIIEDADCKQAVVAISSIICTLCRQNESMTECIINYVIKMLTDREYKEYYVYFTIIGGLMMIDDQSQDKRIDTIMDQLLSLMQKQVQYFYETDVCQQNILRICLTNPKIYKWMVDNQTKWHWMIQQMRDQSMPQEKLLMNNSNPNHCKHRLYGTFLPLNKEGYQMFFNWKLQQYSLLLQNKPLELNPQDVYIKLDEVEVGDFVDYYFPPQNKWIQTQIKELNQEYLTLQFKDIMVDRDSEHLAPYQTLSFVNQIPGSISIHIIGDTLEPLIVDQQDVTLEDNNTEDGNYVSQMSQSNEMDDI